MNIELLIVDDKPKICTSLSQNFSEFRYTCHLAHNGNDAVSIFVNNNIDAVVLYDRLGE